LVQKTLEQKFNTTSPIQRAAHRLKTTKCHNLGEIMHHMQ
jgi:hypothetical protein